MKDMDNKDYTKASALKDLPGAAIDAADDEFTDAALVKERTKTLNDNPRDTDGPEED